MRQNPNVVSRMVRLTSLIAASLAISVSAGCGPNDWKSYEHHEPQVINPTPDMAQQAKDDGGPIDPASCTQKGGVMCNGSCMMNDPANCGACGNACPVGASCKASTCVEPDTCHNGKKDDLEADVDCGGNCRIGCMAGQLCNEGTDCSAGKCEQGRCLCYVNVQCGRSCNQETGQCNCAVDAECLFGGTCVNYICVYPVAR
jgi:hypothetical protein